MLFVPPFFAGSRPAPTYSWRTGPGDATDLSTYTFAAADIGTAGSNRTVVVGIMSIGQALGSVTLTSVTIGGVAATVQATGTNGDRVICAIATASIPTGATADIVVTFGQTMARCVASVWAAYDLQSITARQTTFSSAKPAALSINTSAADLLFAVAYCNTSGSTTWTGITKQFDATVDSALESAADATAATTESPRTITCDYSVSNVERVGVIASFR